MTIEVSRVEEAIQLHGVEPILEDLNTLWESNPRHAIDAFGIEMTDDNFPHTGRGSLGALTAELRKTHQVLMPLMIVKVLDDDETCLIRIIGFEAAALN